MDFSDIEANYEDLWLYHLISHKEFVEYEDQIPESEIIQNISLQQQVLILEMSYYISTLGGLQERTSFFKDSLENNDEIIKSNDPMIKYFLIGIELWHNYMVSNNPDIEAVQKKEFETKKLYDQIYNQNVGNSNLLKYLFPFYAIFGSIYRKYGFYEQARKLLIQGTLFALKIENPLYICIAYFDIREIFEDTLDNQKAIDYGFLCKNKLQELGYLIHEAFITMDMSWIYYKMGKLDEALNFASDTIELYNNASPDKSNPSVMNGLVCCYNQLGKMHTLNGDLDLALTFYNKALDLYRSIKGRMNPSLLSNLGEFYSFKGDYNTSLKFQLEALEIRKERDFSSSNQIPLAESYFSLVKLYIHFHDLEKANIYLTYLKEIHEKWRDKIISTQYKLGLVMILKEKKSMNELSKAQQILNEIIEEPASAIDLTSTALTILIEITLLEYKFFHNKENHDKLNTYIETLRKYNDKSIYLDSKILILQGKLEIVEGDLEKAEKLFIESLQKAKKQNLMNLIEEIKNELAKLNDELLKAKTIINTNININKRIEELELEKYVEDIQEVLGLFRS